MATATMDEMFRLFRDFGMSEKHAGEAARIIPHRDEFVTRADRDAEREAVRATREAERETEREAARAVREAERAADREAFADKGDVTELQTKVKTVEDAIISIDKRFERIDERFERIDERFNGVDKSLVRLDERMNGLESQNSKFFYIFFSLHIVTITGLIALLTKGALWGVAP